MDVRRIGAAACLVGALAVTGWLRWGSAAAVADLRPRPDALEYEEAARSLLAGQGYTIGIASLRLPPRYPPGMSLAIAPVLRLLGGALGSGRVVTWLAALATVAGVWRLTRRAAGVLGATVAALAVAFSPAHTAWSETVMSDVPAAAVVTWLACWAVVGETAVLPWRGFLLGAGIGLSTLLRLDLAVTALPLAFVTLRRSRVLVACLLGVAVGALPTLISNTAWFGAPWRTGYAYWVPVPIFDLHAAFTPPADATEGNVPAYLRMLAGRGRLYPVTVALSALLGATLAWRGTLAVRRTVAVALGVIAATLLLHATHRWQSERFVLPLVPMVATLAGIGMGRRVPAYVRIPGVIALVGSVPVLFATPGAFDPPDRNLYEVATLRAVQAETPPNAVIVVRTSVILAERFLRTGGADRMWVPLGGDQHLEALHARGVVPEAEPGGRWIEPAIDLPFDGARVAATLQRHLTSGRPVFIVAQATGHLGFARPLDEMLRSSFTLRLAGLAGPYKLFAIQSR